MYMYKCMLVFYMMYLHLYVYSPSIATLQNRTINRVNFSLFCSPPLYYPDIRPLQTLSPSNVSCPALFEGIQFEQQRIKTFLKQWTPASDEQILKSLKNCSLLRKDFFNNFYISLTENSFPIAFNMLIYYTGHRLQQQMRLLKYLYRPQNVYCIHIDSNSPQWFINELSSITKCLPNVIIAKNLIRIHYGSVTILDAHLSCLKDLLNTNVQWKYAITLHSPELPMVTMKEIVDILIKMNGSNVIAKGYIFSPNSGVYKWFHKKQVYENGHLHNNGKNLGPIPYNITPLKSAESTNSALSRDFVKFILTDKRALAFRKRLEYVHSAEEFFFTTMNSLPYAPGNSLKLKWMPFVARRIWKHRLKTGECIDRKFIHNICIASVSDLPRLKNFSVTKNTPWFYNKYLAEYDHVVMDCMENLLIQRNYKEYKKDCLNHFRYN